MRLKRYAASMIAILMGNPGALLAGNGYFLHGIGAVNESLGGAATAGNTQDLLGSLHKNPANASLFRGTAAAVSLGIILPDVTFDSSVDALGMSGSSDSEVDTIPAAGLGAVYHGTDSPVAYYAAIFTEAGLHLDVAQSYTNPVFFPQPGDLDNPLSGLYGGFGRVETQMEVLRIPLGLAYQLNSTWSLGGALVPSVSRLKFTPAAFAAPDDANGDGRYTYPTDVDHEIAFGLGFQAGIRYQSSDTLAFAFSASSPTWFEDFAWDVTDESGHDRKISFAIDRPLTFNLGASWQLTTATLLLLDTTWINYADTSGFDATGFGADGALQGLKFDNTWVVGLGLQHQLTNNFSVRAGYQFNNNPVADKVTFFSVGAPLLSEHHLSFGGSWNATRQLTFDCGYTHAFTNSIAGEMYDARGPVPGTLVEAEMGYDQISLGITYAF